MGLGARSWLGWAGAALLLSGSLANGQALAHKGWVGNGLTVASWWDGAILYQIDPLSFQDTKGDGFGDLKGIVQRLDYLQGLGVDAIVLSPFQLRADFGRGSSGPPFDAKYGSEEDLDKLVQEASGRKIRIFVDLPLSASRSTQDLLNVARFWLSRGMAGLRLTEETTGSLTAAQLAERVKELRKIFATYPGQRVLLWDRSEPVPGGVEGRGYAKRRVAPLLATQPQLAVDLRLAALKHFGTTDLRQAMQVPAATATTTVPVSDTSKEARSFDRLGDGSHDVEIAKVLAAALLTGPGAPMLYFGQEIGMATTAGANASGGVPTPMQWGAEAGFTSGVPWVEMGRNAATANVALEDADAASLLNWYRRLGALRHANETLRSGTMQTIAETNPDIVAWVRQPKDNGATSAPVVVVCNTTNRPLIVPVAGDLHYLGLQSSGMMHTLASSSLIAVSGSTSKEMETGPVSVNGIPLPPFGVYIGELAHQPGLESAPAPVRRTHGGSSTSP